MAIFISYSDEIRHHQFYKYLEIFKHRTAQNFGGKSEGLRTESSNVFTLDLESGWNLSKAGQTLFLARCNKNSFQATGSFWSKKAKHFQGFFSATRRQKNWSELCEIKKTGLKPVLCQNETSPEPQVDATRGENLIKLWPQRTKANKTRGTFIGDVLGGSRQQSWGSWVRNPAETEVLETKSIMNRSEMTQYNAPERKNDVWKLHKYRIGNLAKLVFRHLFLYSCQ